MTGTMLKSANDNHDQLWPSLSLVFELLKS